MLRLAIILAALTGAADLLLLLPVGLEARYAAGAFSLTAHAGPVPVRLLPKEPVKKEARAADREAKGVLRRTPRPVLAIAARCGLKALGRLRGRVRLRVLRLRFTAGGGDPYRAVMAYARAGLALEGVERLCAGRVRRLELRAQAVFDAPTALEAEALAQVRLGHLLWAAIVFCFAFFREYYRYKRRKDDAENGRTSGT